MGNTINIDKYVGIGFRGIIPSAIDPSAAAYFTATGITGATQQTAIDNLVKGLKADGLWSKMKAVYPFVTDNRNSMSYTEDFTNAYWSKSGATVTANNITAPDGTMTADRVVYSTTNNYVYGVSTLLGGVGTQSFYVKGTAGETLYADDGYTSAPLITLTGNWQRVEFTTTRPSGQTHGILIGTYSGATARTIWLWGAQVDAAATATTYQPIATTQQAFISSQFKYNLVNPVDSDAAFRLVFNGGWTHSSNGATPNGTNGYADTKLVPSSVLTQNSAHLSFYSRTDIVSGVDLGSANSLAPFKEIQIAPRIVTTSNFSAINASGALASFTDTSSISMMIASRIASTEYKFYRAGTLRSTQTNTSDSPNSLNIYLSARNFGGSAGNYSVRQTAFSSIGDGLTDTEAANLYTRVQTFNQALSRQVGVPIVSDADAQAFLNSAEITDITQANAINTLVTDLKAQGLWTKMKAIYPFVGGTATTHKYNLKDPRDLDAAYRLVFNGGWTHSSTGATPNGTNGYADTKLVPSSVLTLNSTHLSFYSRTSGIVSGQRDIGVFIDGNEPCMSLGTNTGVQLSDSYSFATNRLSASIANALGFVNGSRVSSTSHKLYKSGAQIGTTDTFANVITLPNQNVYLGAVNVAPNPVLVTGYSTKQTAFATIGDGLNDTEATALYNAVNNYQVALSRNI